MMPADEIGAGYTVSVTPKRCSSGARTTAHGGIRFRLPTPLKEPAATKQILRTSSSVGSFANSSFASAMDPLSSGLVKVVHSKEPRRVSSVDRGSFPAAVREALRRRMELIRH